MLGIILCGGKSSRMGSDKGLLKLEAKTWAQTAFDKLAELNFPIVISVNKKQLTDYASVFNATELISDDPSLSIHGPLSGVLSVHLQHPAEDLMILACDKPLMETVLLKELLVQYNHYPTEDAFIFTNEGEPEPLCGIYKGKGLAHILELYKNNQLPKHSMKYMLEHVLTHTVPLPEDKKKCFRNFNAHAELNGL